MTDHNEQQRYLNYLQKQLIQENSEPVLEEKKQWFIQFRKDYLSALKNNKIKSHNQIRLIEENLISHQDKTENDCFFASNIFGPLLDDLLILFKEAEIAPKNPVEFANSPSLSPSPTVYPSEGTHYLFAGEGTFCYCNYWAKIFSSLLDKISSKPSSILSKEQLNKDLAGLPTVKRAKELSVYFSIYGSLIGFGKVKQEENNLGVRVLLLQAMEAFVISHEIAHFSMHEIYPETGGVAEDESEKDLESNCDTLGLAISTAYGNKKENPYAFQFLGALVFFYSLKISYAVKEVIFGCKPEKSDSHPTLDERIDSVFLFASEVSQQSLLITNMNEIKIIAEVLENLVLEEVEDALQSFAK